MSSRLRFFKSHESVHGEPAKTSNAQVSMIFSPMRNKDIERAAKSGDWSELEEKAKNMQRKYERCFGTDACFIQKKPDGNLLKKGCK